MRQQVEETARDAILVEDAALIRMMGMPVLEAVPSRTATYERTDPFILVHEGRFRLSEMAAKDTKHPHRGFDNLWYVLQGSASTGHTTGPGGSVERARLSRGRSSRSGRDEERGTPRAWEPTRSRRATATLSSAASSSG